MNVIVKSKWEWEMGYSRKKTNGGLRRYFFKPNPPSPWNFKVFNFTPRNSIRNMEQNSVTPLRNFKA